MSDVPPPALPGLDELPRAPGVYLFHGASGPQGLPLYIGKSVNLRARVLSHLREPSEARMMAQTTRVSFIRTAGELGALLLESRLIKARQPLYNIRLRRSRHLLSWRLDPADAAPLPQLVDSRQLDFAGTEGLFGLYPSAHAARASLMALAQEHGLCLSTLGLEARQPRGCFNLQLRRCAGACVGRESPAEHRARLIAALEAQRVARWPFPEAQEIVERDGDWAQVHVIDRWRLLRTEQRGPVPPEALADDGQADPLCGPRSGFDLDEYRILVRAMLGLTLDEGTGVGVDEAPAAEACAAPDRPARQRRPRRR